MTTTRRADCAVLAGACLAAAAVVWWPHVRNEFFVILGNRDEAGGWYGWWSGNAGGLQPFEWLTLGGLLMWHHQCHVSGCFWPTRRVTAAGERACWRHHPEPQRTAGDLHRAHHAAKARQAA